MLETNKIYCGDCLELMPDIPDGSIDMILTDVPYGTTACSWDTIIPLEPMWEQIKRVIKPNGAIVMTASQPFTTTLISSNMKMFKYEWIWEKSVASCPFDAKNKPMKIHDNIVIFSLGDVPTNSRNKMKYFPQELCKINRVCKNLKTNRVSYGGNRPGLNNTYVQSFTGYPTSILKFRNDKRLHPTQKPVALFEYLIKTYTNEGDTVLDFVIGSGTTAVACIRTGRRYIGMEISQEYCDIANKRIERELSQLKLDL